MYPHKSNILGEMLLHSNWLLKVYLQDVSFILLLTILKSCDWMHLWSTWMEFLWSATDLLGACIPWFQHLYLCFIFFTYINRLQYQTYSEFRLYIPCVQLWILYPVGTVFNLRSSMASSSVAPDVTHDQVDHYCTASLRTHAVTTPSLLPDLVNQHNDALYFTYSVATFHL